MALRLPSFSLFRRFARAERGVALVEFAFTLPVMVILYLGSIAVTQGMMTDRKVTLLARSIGDITAQDTDISSAERDNIFNAGRVVMAPYDSGATVLRMRVTSVRVRADSSTCVEWSMGPQGSSFLRTAGSSVNDVVPASIRAANTWLIMSEVEYTYTPIVGEDITGQLNLTERLYMRPRLSQQVTFFNQPATTACP
jgi:Flp pilus assembly protein TadG